MKKKTHKRDKVIALTLGQFEMALNDAWYNGFFAVDDEAFDKIAEKVAKADIKFLVNRALTNGGEPEMEEND